MVRHQVLLSATLAVQSNAWMNAYMHFSGILESCSVRQSCIFMRVALILVTPAFLGTSTLLTCYNLTLNNNAFFLV